MTSRTALLALAFALAAQPAAAQLPEPSAPVQQPVATTPPVPADTPWPGGAMTLAIDASDTRRGLYRVTQTIPVPRGMTTLTLLYPEWLPGNHAPRGPISLLSDIRFSANGRPLAWRRNPLDVYQFDVTVPEGVRLVTASFAHTSPLQASEGRITMTQEMLNLQWEKMSLYPAGHYTRRIAVRPSVRFPEGWRAFTALDGQLVGGSTVTWDQTDYQRLVDSPIFAGRYAKDWTIGQNVTLDAVADKPAQLSIKPEHLTTFERMVTEADEIFGGRPFDRYRFLLAMTDRMGGIGLEHQRSSENQFEPDSLVKWDEMDWDRNVVAHELVHAWNGKYRRPEGLWTADYRLPMQNNLLWVYEGQTQFWGYVLAARSGLQKKETVLGMFAAAAATYSEGQPGRAWRSVEDTTFDPIISARRPLPYSSLQRSEDYYVEGALVWLEADQIIRRGTGGARGLDDFARAFFGATPGDPGQRTYDFAEVVRTLNGIHAYDWASFLDTRLRQSNQPAPLAGVTAAGYRLVWKDTMNPFDKGRFDHGKVVNLTYSLGLVLDSSGKVTSTLYDGPAFDAGIVNGAQIVAVNGEAYAKDVLTSAITAAKGGREPIRLLVKRGDRFDTIAVPYHGGLRWPWLEPVAAGEQGFDRLLRARTTP
ncbi:M61 family metallopeptidase [Qipengyuania sediminis]|uniref:M61 family metallopeptidase n=1 Tax=Qipengyuania sediminis TaxID=1532023 RepID=UPI001059EF9E|nr:M61 family metallopeptidase [Qipengyuania sediminis]